MADPATIAAQGYALDRDTLLVSGADARTWLDGLVTCAVSEVRVGAAAYGLLLTKQGKIVTDLWLAFAEDGSLYVGVAPGHGGAVRELLDRYLVMEDAELSAPPQALSWRLFDAAAAPEKEGEVAWGSVRLGTSSLTVQVSTRSTAGMPRAAELLAALGLGTYGIDFTERDNPHEASLDRIAVSWTKGCYLGQEVVCMQDMRGKVKRRLVPLVGDEGLLDLHEAATGQGSLSVLGVSGAEVGQVTSAHRTPDGALLLASVAASALDEPTELSVLGRKVRLGSGPVPRPA